MPLTIEDIINKREPRGFQWRTQITGPTISVSITGSRMGMLPNFVTSFSVAILDTRLDILITSRFYPEADCEALLLTADETVQLVNRFFK